MMMKIKRKNLIGLVLSFVLILLCFMLPLNREILLLLNLSLVVVTLVKTKVSIISLWSIISNYVILNVYVYDVVGTAYGILGLTKISFVPMLRYMLIWNLSLFFWGYATNFLDKERELQIFDSFYQNRNFIIICSVIAISAILIAFPTKPFTFGNRFISLLPGNAWNHLSIIALLYMLPSIKKNKLTQVTYVFVLFWFLSHYERVDVLGILLVLAFMYLAKNKIKRDGWKKIAKISGIGLFAFVLLSYLGEARMNSTFSISDIFNKVLRQNTASDVGYIYDLAIRYINEHDFLYGLSYLRYFVKFLPGIDLSYLETTKILANYYPVPGGSFILNEPLMNFGIAGVIFIPNLLIFLTYSLLKKKTNLRYILYIFLLATSFRYLWYGIEYIITGIVLIIPTIYLLYRIFGRKRKKNDICGDARKTRKSIIPIRSSEKFTK